METAKDILEKHGIHELPADEVKDILVAMQEIADKAWEAATAHQATLGAFPDKYPDKSTFMKSLFP